MAYTCDDGWLVGRVEQDLRISYPKHNHYDYKDVDYGLSSLGPQIVRLRRDVEGGLVGRAKVREALEFTWQAGSGKGLPYWFEINTYWTHWMATVPKPVPTPNDVIAPEKLQRIERQAYEQENGVGSYAAATAKDKSPNVSAPAILASAAVSPADMRAMVARHIDSNATLADVRREDDRYVLTLHVTARGQVTRTIESLSNDAAFADVQDHGIIASGSQKDVATISLKRRQ